MERTHIFIPKPMKDRLIELAIKYDIKVSELIRRAIYEFIMRNR